MELTKTQVSIYLSMEQRSHVLSNQWSTETKSQFTTVVSGVTDDFSRFH